MDNDIDKKASLIAPIMGLLSEPDLENRLKDKDAWQDIITCKCGAEFNSYWDYIDHCHKSSWPWWQIWKYYILPHQMKRNRTLLLGHVLYDSGDLLNK